MRTTTRKRETRCAFCIDPRMKRVIETAARRHRQGESKISMGALHRSLALAVPGIPELPALQQHIARHAGGWTE